MPATASEIRKQIADATDAAIALRVEVEASGNWPPEDVERATQAALKLKAEADRLEQQVNELEAFADQAN
jgi:hypothetical protein